GAGDRGEGPPLSSPPWRRRRRPSRHAWTRPPSDVTRVGTSPLPDRSGSGCTALAQGASVRSTLRRRRLAMATVVVGVDSSEGAKRALAFALEESRLRGATLLAVHAWSFPAIAASAGMFAPPVEFDFEELKRDAEQSLNTVIDEVVGVGHGIEIERKVVEGAA